MDERFLDRVLGSLAVTGNEECDREEAVADAGREHLEGLVIAVLRRFHDISPHRPLHRLRDRVAAPSTYDGLRSETVQEWQVGLPELDGRHCVGTTSAMETEIIGRHGWTRPRFAFPKRLATLRAAAEGLASLRSGIRGEPSVEPATDHR